MQQVAPEATPQPEAQPQPKETARAASTTAETATPAAETSAVETKKEPTKTTGNVALPVPTSGDVKEDIKTKVHTDPDKNTLGIAQSFHIFANEANLKTHTNGSIATKKLTGGEANFGTNVKDDDTYKNKFSDISYIQSVALNVNIQSSSGVTERDTLLVVGKDIAVSVVDNGNYYALNDRKMDHIKQIAQDTDTTYIDFEQEFSNLRTVSQSFSTGDTTAAVLKRQGSNYTLDLTDSKITDGKIVLNLDANDLTDESGDLTIASIPDGAIVVVNVKAANAQQTLDIQKKIVLSYANGTTRANQETENFTDSTLLWNFESFNGLINLQKAWQGTILATDASLYSDSNIDGSIIVDKFLGAGETHRWDFQGTITPENPKPNESTPEETPDEPVIVTPPVDEIVEKPALETPTEEIADEEVEEEQVAPVETPKTQQPDTPSDKTSNVVNDPIHPTTKQPSLLTQSSTDTVVTPTSTTPVETASTVDTSQVTTATGLPQTGEQSTTAVGIGLGALLAGAVALLFGRRKR